jgi:multisubunit Na+/H+ antiporter MnhB subunit
MRYVVVGAAVLWLVSAFFFLVTWDWSPDRSVEWAAAVITVGGIVLGVLGAIVVAVSAIWSGHKEKKQWE